MSSEALAPASSADALDVVRAAVAIVLELDPAGLAAATTFTDLAADSLALVGIADQIEASLTPDSALRIDDGALAAMTTLGELADYVRREVVS